MSPSRRVKVARAGNPTSFLAVSLVLWDAIATGRDTTNRAAPNTVAARQSGRTMSTSAAMTSGLPSSCAQLLGVWTKSNAVAQHNAKLMGARFIEAARVREGRFVVGFMEGI